MTERSSGSLHCEVSEQYCLTMQTAVTEDLDTNSLQSIVVKLAMEIVVNRSQVSGKKRYAELSWDRSFPLITSRR